MQNSNFHGILLMVLSMLGFSIQDVFLKFLASDYPASQILAGTGFGAAAILAVLAKVQGAPLYSPLLRNKYVLIRSAADFIGAIFFIWSMILLPLTIISSLVQAIPLLVTAGAALFLNETVGARRWSAIATGFIGVLIIIRPTAEGMNIGAILALGFVFALGLRDLVTRKMQVKLPSTTVAIYGFLAMGMGGVALAPFSGAIKPMPAIASAWLVCSAMFGVVGYYTLVIATRISDASVIAPFRYARLVFALALAYVFFGETLDGFTGFGVILVIGSGLYTFAREARLTRRPRK